MQAGRFEEAAAIYQTLVAARPADPGLLMNLGMARYMSGDPSSALAPLREATRRQPALAPAWLFLGAALLDLGRATESVAPLGRAVRAMPRHTDAREMLARASLTLGRHTAALIHYRALTELDPSSARGWHGLARSYQGVAETTFEALRSSAPDSPLLPLLLADVLVAQGRYAEALAVYRRVPAHELPVGGLHQAVAELYERAGRREWAAAERAKTSPLTPAHCATRRPECDFLAGRIRSSFASAQPAATAVGRYWTIRAANRLATEALAALEALPPSVELHMIRAEIAQTRGQHRDAVNELRAALALAPADPAAEEALAEALVLAREVDTALPMLERLVRARPGSVPLLFLFSNALLDTQQIDRAIPILERVVTLEPSLLPARAALGRAYVIAGRHDAAVPHLQAALPSDEDGSVHYQLGQSFQALGREDDARRAMAAALRRRPPQSEQPADVGAPPQLTPP